MTMLYKDCASEVSNFVLVSLEPMSGTFRNIGLKIPMPWIHSGWATSLLQYCSMCKRRQSTADSVWNLTLAN